MFKSFIIALVSASCADARGKNDGSSAENAVTEIIISSQNGGVQTYVHHWKELSDSGRTQQLHADTELKFTREMLPNISIGFCLEKSDAAQAQAFDCQQINVDIATNKYGVASKDKFQFDVLKFLHFGDFQDFDYSSGVSNKNDFIIDWSESYTNCSPILGSEKVTCPKGINIRWTRDVKTLFGEEVPQCSLQDSSAPRSAFGFVYEWMNDVWNERGVDFPHGK